MDRGGFLVRGASTVKAEGSSRASLRYLVAGSHRSRRPAEKEAPYANHRRASVRTSEMRRLGNEVECVGSNVAPFKAETQARIRWGRSPFFVGETLPRLGCLIRPVKLLHQLALVAILALSTPVSGLSQSPATCPGILSVQQLTTLLTGKVLEPRVVQFIKQCGIGFEVTDWAESRLRKAGATTAVINAARARVDQQREWRRLKFEFVRVAPGEFTMGCSAGDNQCDDAERPAHRVRIITGFEIGKYEVTQAMWESVMGSNPSHFKDFPNRPVERVTGDDIQQ